MQAINVMLGKPHRDSKARSSFSPSRSRNKMKLEGDGSPKEFEIIETDRKLLTGSATDRHNCP